MVVKCSLIVQAESVKDDGCDGSNGFYHNELQDTLLHATVKNSKDRRLKILLVRLKRGETVERPRLLYPAFEL